MRRLSSLHASYEDMLTKCLTGVKVLLVKCQEYINQAVPLKTLPSARAIEGTDQETGQAISHLKQVSVFLVGACAIYLYMLCI